MDVLEYLLSLYIPQEGPTIDLDRAQLFFVPSLKRNTLEQASDAVPRRRNVR